MGEKKLHIVEPDDVETLTFDWGRINWLTEPRVTPAERMAAGIVRVAPGYGHARHNHPESEELLYIIQGTGVQTLEVDGETIEQKIGPGSLVQIPTAAYHSTYNTGDDEMIVFAVYGPHGPEALMRQMPGCKIEPPRRG